MSATVVKESRSIKQASSSMSSPSSPSRGWPSSMNLDDLCLERLRTSQKRGMKPLGRGKLAATMSGVEGRVTASERGTAWKEPSTTSRSGRSVVVRKGEPRTESRRRVKSESAWTACWRRRRERRARGEREVGANMDSILTLAATFMYNTESEPSPPKAL